MADARPAINIRSKQDLADDFLEIYLPTLDVGSPGETAADLRAEVETWFSGRLEHYLVALQQLEAHITYLEQNLIEPRDPIALASTLRDYGFTVRPVRMPSGRTEGAELEGHGLEQESSTPERVPETWTKAEWDLKQAERKARLGL